MKMRSDNIPLHLILIGCVTALLVLCMLLPFLPGDYDAMAVPVSAGAQIVAMLGLLLVPVGIPWIVHEISKGIRRRRNLLAANKAYGFALVSVVICSIIAALVAMAAFFAFSRFLAVIILGLMLYGIHGLIPALKVLKKADATRFNVTPLYLVIIPLLALAFQLTFATQLTEWSRNRAMANASEFIGHIEEFRARHGRYPESLVAQHKDYYPDVAGVEKYHYLPKGDSYNLSFEQPRFAFSEIGTREWVVYNPRDEHRMYSHTAWFLLLSPEQLEQSQGWYAAHDASRPHWKYFWFD
jgi:hypothetical protein